MSRFDAPDRSASGLRRLLRFQERGGALFQADRARENLGEVYPSSPPVSLDPLIFRGEWCVGTGFLLPPPLVRYVLSSAIAVALYTFTRARDGSGSAHFDEFPDGYIALTLAERQENRGVLSEALARASKLKDEEPLGDFFVNVLPRASFPVDRLGFPVPGMYVAADRVPVLERVQLTAGDLRCCECFLAEPLPELDGDIARAEPFTELFARGGQIQFDAVSGRVRRIRRIPTRSDREAALAQARERALHWLGRRTRSQPEGAASASGTLQRAVGYIRQHCERPLTVREISDSVGVSAHRLHELFRTRLGCAPLEYVAERRLDRAEYLLTRTDLSIVVIAERCGFSEQSSLTRSLKRRRGITPGKLRSAWANGSAPDPG